VPSVDLINWSTGCCPKGLAVKNYNSARLLTSYPCEYPGCLSALLPDCLCGPLSRPSRPRLSATSRYRPVNCPTAVNEQSMQFTASFLQIYTNKLTWRPCWQASYSNSNSSNKRTWHVLQVWLQKLLMRVQCDTFFQPIFLHFKCLFFLVF